MTRSTPTPMCRPASVVPHNTEKPWHHAPCSTFVGGSWLFIAVLLVAAAAPADPVVARDGAATVTASQLRAMVAALPPDARAQAAANPATLTALLRARLLQDVLYAAARASKFDRRADVQQQAEQARETAIVRAYVATQLTPPPPPSDAQVSAAYDANKTQLMVPRAFHLAQIFLAVPPQADAAAAEKQRLRLANLRPALLGKPDQFAEIAKHLSDDTRSARAGGDLGWLRQDAIAEPVRSAAMGLQEDGLSDPLRTPDGWHLIELIATKPAGPMTLDQARPTIAEALQQRQQQMAANAYLDTVLQRAPVRIDTAALNAAIRPAAEP